MSHNEQYEPYPPPFSFVNPEWEAIRQKVNCPTCDGSRMNPALGRTATYLCPDCTDGKIPMARLLERGVQFASAVELLTTVSNDHRTGKFMQWDVQKFLRKVQP